MGGGFHYYFDAARALWDMPSQELYSLARSDQSEAVQRAAELTLRLKAEYVTPEALRDERSALTRLASALSDDPEFTIDMALTIGNRRRATTRVPQDIQWTTRRSPKAILLWVAVTSAVALLVLDVLATAGVPVPTPIGNLLDRVSGEDFAPQTPAPSPSGVGVLDHPRRTASVAIDETTTPVTVAGSVWGTQANEAGSKNPHHANGKDRNFKNGKERNFKNGKKKHQREQKKTYKLVHATSRSRSASAREHARDMWHRVKPKKKKR